MTEKKASLVPKTLILPFMLVTSLVGLCKRYYQSDGGCI
jgi:hypothetical protein